MLSEMFSPVRRMYQLTTHLLPTSLSHTSIRPFHCSNSSIPSFSTHIDTTAASRSTPKPVLPALSDYPHHLHLTTRFGDVDRYAHVNNVQYYSYFDT